MKKELKKLKETTKNKELKKALDKKLKSLKKEEILK